MAYLLLKFVFPSMMAGRTTGDVAGERAAAVRASGQVIATERAGGRLGEVWFSGPLLRISVYPAGIVIKPALMTEHAILASEIRRVVHAGGVLGRRVEVEHAGIDSASPFVVSGQSSDGPLVRAIESVAPMTEPGPTEIGDSSPRHPTSSKRAGLSMGVQGAPNGVMATLGIFGIGVNILMIAIGLFWAIPELGAFGILWTLFAIFIAATNVRRMLSRR
jgi:hypothetical protein